MYSSLRLLFICCFLAPTLLTAQTAWQPYQSSATFTTDWLRSNLLSKADFQPFPAKTDRSFWDAIPSEVKTNWIAAAEQVAQEDWKALSVTQFMDYVRNGNRTRYEAVLFARRSRVATLLLAELLENKGRFTDELLDGVWLILEETYWGVPAHLPGTGLPDVQDPIVDLFAAQTGNLLSWVHYFMKTDFDTINPLINQRIYTEINNKLLKPYLLRNDFWWMGLRSDRTVVNNWNPWINSNILSAALFFADDTHRATIVNKVLLTLDRFLMPYPNDGGCDEGPGYWGHAAGSLFDALEHLYAATNGKINYYDHPLIQNMAKYVYRASITPDFVVNFADASAKASFSGGLVYRFGKRINDSDMMAFGAYYYNRSQSLKRSQGWDLFRLVSDMVVHQELKKSEGKPILVEDVWLPALQVMAARSQANEVKGYYLAAKGGHNNESHNHNDVGQFIFFKDGQPILVDAGVGNYTAKTFSKDRYTIWTMVSEYHNLPSIGKNTQQPGRQYAAKQVAYQADSEKAQFELDIAGTYADDAGIQTWKRKLTLDRKTGLELSENFSFSKTVDFFTLNLITPCKVDISQTGKIQFLEFQTGKVLCQATYDKSYWEASVEDIPMNQPEDARVKESWSNGLRRIILKHNNQVMQGVYRLKFK